MKRDTRCRHQSGRKELGFHPMSKEHPLKDVKWEWLPKVGDEQALLDMRGH